MGQVAFIGIAYAHRQFMRRDLGVLFGEKKTVELEIAMKKDTLIVEVGGMLHQ
jgi:hypothetical protein